MLPKGQFFLKVHHRINMFEVIDVWDRSAIRQIGVVEAAMVTT